MRVTLFRDIEEDNWPSMELYADRLTQHLLDLFGDEVVVKPVTAGPLVPRVKGKCLTASIYASRVLKYPVVARLNQGDLNHVVDHSYAQLVHFLDSRRTVVTCHDLAPLVLRDALSRPSIGLALWDWALKGMLKAARIIADSENTRRDILRLTDYPANRVEVIYPGIDDSFRPIANREALQKARERLMLPSAAIVLHVGHCGKRKNVEGILMALNELVRSKIDQVHFVQVGGVFSHEQRRLMDRFQLQSHVMQISQVSSPDLILLYNLADVFVFPSHYEGFGFPPLEAMACGTPVVCSNGSSLPEVVGDAAITVEPADYQALADAVERVLSEGSTRSALIAKGLARAKSFSWEACARRTFAVYQEVCNENYN